MHLRRDANPPMGLIATIRVGKGGVVGDWGDVFSGWGDVGDALGDWGDIAAE